MPKDKKKKHICPRCGKEDDFEVSNEFDLGNTIYTCRKCHYQGNPIEASLNPFVIKAQNESIGSDTQQASDQPNPESNPSNTKTRGIIKKKRIRPEKEVQDYKDEETVRRVSHMANPFIKKAAWDISMSQEGWDNVRQNVYNKDAEWLAEALASDALAKEDIFNPTEALKKFEQLKIKFMKLPHDILSDEVIRTIEENNTATNGGFEVYVDKNGDYKVSVDLEEDNDVEGDNDVLSKNKNPFIKSAKDKEKRPLRRCDSEEKKEEREERRKDCPFQNKTYDKKRKIKIDKKSSNNPFVKQAREFLYTEEQKEKKMDRNMIFPEGIQTDKYDEKIKSTKNPPTDGDAYDDDVYYDYDTVDRKEYHRSPNPNDFLPGHKEWVERQVDKYYDGWVDDHIKNSGGSIPGSNTEKTMNLNEGERNHPPAYPNEAPTEKMLESRHNFDGDYERKIAQKKRLKKVSMNSQELLMLVKNEDPEVMAVLKEAGITPKELRENGDFIRQIIAKLEKDKNETPFGMSDQELENGIEKILDKESSSKKKILAQEYWFHTVPTPSIKMKK